ncbi:hypothetical protein HCU66_20775 [Pseudomonas frederiksbergensis]|uniref:hypothetical protein n=1 Tax=Pseudomonas frederiksbergensis TaxID=104087 RepID=UPI00197F5FCF|nr:hypothetical protein [Pseudomonas frederiksbergensis]MBN3864670.1 hypothetical protein [Pseudomonas frederiksbergensis]
MPNIASIYAELSPLVSPLWENIKGFANSAFTTSLAGAFAGAIAAQRIAEKGKFREELVKEFHHTNAVIVLAIATASVALALKKQHIKGLKEAYDEDQRNYQAHREKILNRQIAANTPLVINPNLLYLQEISPPIATIQEIVLSRLSTLGRAISTVTALTDAVANLNGALSMRNELLEVFKNKQFPEGATLEHMYLGLRYGEGHTNQEYGGSIQAISTYTDDVIFFCIKLCEDVRDHGEILNQRFKSRLRGDPPEISRFDFEGARQEGWIPKDEDYEKWLSGFVSVPRNAPNWWQRINPRNWFN